jgi:hypothetical protein
MSAQIAQLFIAVDRRSDGSHRVSLVYNAASNPNPNPSSLLPQSLLSCLSPLVPLLSSRYWIRLTHPPSNPPHPSPSLRSAAPAPTLPRRSTGILDFAAVLEDGFLDALCGGGGAGLFGCLGPWRGLAEAGHQRGPRCRTRRGRAPGTAAMPGSERRRAKLNLSLCVPRRNLRMPWLTTRCAYYPPPPLSILRRLYFGGSGQSHFPNNCARHPLWPQILPYIPSPVLGFDLVGRNACASVTTVTV